MIYNILGSGKRTPEWVFLIHPHVVDPVVWILPLILLDSPLSLYAVHRSRSPQHQEVLWEIELHFAAQNKVIFLFAYEQGVLTNQILHDEIPSPCIGQEKHFVDFRVLHLDDP